jgi:hypothetical protein
MQDGKLAVTALRVLSAWTHGNGSESDDLKLLRAHAMSDETSLPPDELACRIVSRECQRVMYESQTHRKAIGLRDHRSRRTA